MHYNNIITDKNISIKPHRGKVHSVFKHGIYFLDGEGFFWAIISQPSHLNSYCALVTCDKLYRLYKTLKPENEYILTADSLIFPKYNISINNSISLGISNRTKFERKPEFSIEKWGNFKREIETQIYPLIEKNQVWDDISRHIFEKRVKVFTESVGEKNLDLALRTAFDLIGFGPGLTPAGDDFLCGFGLVFYYLSHLTGNGLDFIKSLQKLIIKHAKTKTTIFSVKLLELAARGESFRCVNALLECIFYKKDKDIFKNLSQEVLSIGSSSGRTIIEGIYEGLIIFNKAYLT